MNESGLASGSPHIHIAVDSGEVRIRQSRPPVLAALGGLEVEQALSTVPTLLPICGTAQSVAATRAVEAALGQDPSPEHERDREQRLRWEQAQSAAWRLALDWSDLAGAERPMVWLKAARAAENPQSLAGLLQDALPKLDPVATVDVLEAWAREGTCIAARVAARALDNPASQETPHSDSFLTGEHDVADRAMDRLRDAGFDHRGAVEEPLSVGPLAMPRDPLVQTLRQRFGTGTTARLLAILLDTRHIMRSLTATSASCRTPVNAWREETSSGFGRAQTARGPVFHHVRLDSRGRVEEWRALAPTDWHFAPGGPAEGALANASSEAGARLTVASFDPCAPWTLQMDTED